MTRFNLAVDPGVKVAYRCYDARHIRGPYPRLLVLKRAVENASLQSIRRLKPVLFRGQYLGNARK